MTCSLATNSKKPDYFHNLTSQKTYFCKCCLKFPKICIFWRKLRKNTKMVMEMKSLNKNFLWTKNMTSYLFLDEKFAIKHRQNGRTFKNNPWSLQLETTSFTFFTISNISNEEICSLFLLKILYLFSSCMHNFSHLSELNLILFTYSSRHYRD